MSTAQQLIDYIQQEIIRRSGVHIAEDTALVTSGLVDSLALVQILLKLEDVTHRRIAAAKIQPKDMDTVARMLATAERLGKPRR